MRQRKKETSAVEFYIGLKKKKNEEPKETKELEDANQAEKQEEPFLESGSKSSEEESEESEEESSFDEERVEKFTSQIRMRERRGTKIKQLIERKEMDDDEFWTTNNKYFQSKNRIPSVNANGLASIL